MYFNQGVASEYMAGFECLTIQCHGLAPECYIGITWRKAY